MMTVEADAWPHYQWKIGTKKLCALLAPSVAFRAKCRGLTWDTTEVWRMSCTCWLAEELNLLVRRGVVAGAP